MRTISTFTRLALAGVALLFAACASVPEPVELGGKEADLRQLVGTWSGTYSYLGNGRRGSIRIMLRVDPAADATIAFGDVLMVPTTLADSRQKPGTEVPTGPLVSPQALGVRFVSVSGDLVSGTMEPYNGPDSGGLLSTTFSGRVHGDVIEGIFLASGGTANAPRRGTWRVERQAEKPR